MPSAYLWCPAYPLATADQLAAARAGAARFAAGARCEIVESPTLARLGRPGDWPPAEERAADLERALAHDIVLAARGGYGCADLAGAVLTHPGRLPFLVGFSDLTVLHGCWRRRGAGETCYGFMPGATRGERALATALACVRGEGCAISEADHPTVRALTAGRAEGELFAACLCILASLCGTPAMPPLDRTILALEDIDERPYRIDRCLGQLHAAGALAGVRGLVFGSLRCRLPDDYAGPSAEAICRGWAERLGVPAVFGLPFGHEDDPLALPCGRPTSLAVENGTWRLAIAPRR